MQLLQLPQELLDAIAEHLDAISLFAVRSASAHLFTGFGGDKTLRKALIALETHWASISHITSILQKLEEKHGLSTFYPSYKHYLRQAPCYHCLCISTPQNTLYPDDKYMIPWAGFGGFTSPCNSINAQRKCIDCEISIAKEQGIKQQRHLTFAEEFSYKFCCRNCGVIDVIAYDLRFLARFRQSCLCFTCFDGLDKGWRDFKQRLDIRVRRLQKYYDHLRLRLDPHVLYRGRGGVGPLPPRHDVQEDIEVWQQVFNEPRGFDVEERFEMFKTVVAKTASYLSWMQDIDKAWFCKHKLRGPPQMGKLTNFGPWPQWEEMLQRMRNNSDEWGLRACDRLCEERDREQSTTEE